MERLLAALLLFVLFVAIVAPGIRREPTAALPAAAPVDDWRRTASGWERAGRWEQQMQKSAPSRKAHPVLLAALCLMISVGALVGFSPRVHPLPATRH